jgi:hypothetical protein
MDETARAGQTLSLQNEADMGKRIPVEKRREGCEKKKKKFFNNFSLSKSIPTAWSVLSTVFSHLRGGLYEI